MENCLPFTYYAMVLYDFWITVKAATLIVIFGRGSAISSAQEENQVLSFSAKS